jgi:hypothetical protein
MTHEEMMNHAVTLSAAFIQNGDLRHSGNFRDDGSADIQEQVGLLVIQMYRAIKEASSEAQNDPWAKPRD